MSRNLKRLTTSLIVALTLATPQLTYGTENAAEPGDRYVNANKKLVICYEPELPQLGDYAYKEEYDVALEEYYKLKANTITLGEHLAPNQSLPLVEENIDLSKWSALGTIPRDVWGIIAKHAAIKRIRENESPAVVALVCKGWFAAIKSDFDNRGDVWKAWYGVTPEYEEIHQIFLNGVLVYKPDPDSDEGKIELKISDLANPYNGTFDLPEEVGKYLRIYTGYRKGMKPENVKKIETWFVPWFLIKKHLGSTADHFKDMIGGWNGDTAPVGILFNSGGCDNLTWYDYLTSESLTILASKNLYENWLAAAHTISHKPYPRCLTTTMIAKFHVHFVN